VSLLVARHTDGKDLRSAPARRSLAGPDAT
jgi:hypothetical protein